MSNGNYSDCTIKITDADGNDSNILTIPAFTVQATTSSSTASTIAAGHSHTCALLDNASVKCWGNNNSGQLGIDSTTNMGNSSGDMASLDAIDL